MQQSTSTALQLVVQDIPECDRPDYESLFLNIQQKVYRMTSAELSSLSLSELMSKYLTLPPNLPVTRRIFMLAITTAVKNKKRK